MKLTNLHGKILLALDITVLLITAKSLKYISAHNGMIALVLVVYALMLYMFDFYKIRRIKPAKYFAFVLVFLLFFDAANILLQYVTIYKPVYGRKVLLSIDLVLALYFIVRYFLVSMTVDNTRTGIYYVQVQDEIPLYPLIENIKSDLFSYMGTCRLIEGAFTQDAHKLNSGSFFVINSISLYDTGTQKELLRMKMRGVNILSYESFCELYLEKIPVEAITEEWVILSAGFDTIFSNTYVKAKRIFDIAVSLFGLTVTSPLLLLSAVAIKLESKGPAFFKQIRTGLNGEPFTIYKLRSMRSDAEKDGAKWAAENDSRITGTGNFLRKTRIDELPQLINVLKGDMSFIGPRPERPEFDRQLEEAIPFYMVRYTVKPGLTGWAQVNYGYGASTEDSKEKLMYDIYYIKNYSFVLDCRIILRTIHIVLFGKGR